MKMTKHICAAMVVLLYVGALAQNGIQMDDVDGLEEDGGMIVNAVHGMASHFWKVMYPYGRSARKLLGALDKDDCTEIDEDVGSLETVPNLKTAGLATSDQISESAEAVKNLFDGVVDDHDLTAALPGWDMKMIAAKAKVDDGVMLHRGDGVSAYFRPKAVKSTLIATASSQNRGLFSLVKYENMNYQICPGTSATKDENGRDDFYFNDPVIGLGAWECQATSSGNAPDVKWECGDLTQSIKADITETTGSPPANVGIVSIEFPLNPTFRQFIEKKLEDVLECAWFNTASMTNTWTADPTVTNCHGVWNKEIERMVCDCKNLGLFAVVVRKENKDAVPALPSNTTDPTPAPTDSSDDDNTVLYIVIGVAAGVVILAILCAAYYLKTRDEHHGGYSTDSYSDDDHSDRSYSDRRGTDSDDTRRDTHRVQHRDIEMDDIRRDTHMAHPRYTDSEEIRRGTGIVR